VSYQIDDDEYYYPREEEDDGLGPGAPMYVPWVPSYTPEVKEDDDDPDYYIGPVPVDPIIDYLLPTPSLDPETEQAINNSEDQHVDIDDDGEIASSTGETTDQASEDAAVASANASASNTSDNIFGGFMDSIMKFLPLMLMMKMFTGGSGGGLFGGGGGRTIVLGR
jgi:hypothetical protein